MRIQAHEQIRELLTDYGKIDILWYDGSIEPLQIQRLKEIGKWLSKYGESIYKTRGGPIKREDWGGTTHIDNTMYVHVCNWRENEIIIPDAGKANITSLTSPEISVRKQDGKIFLSVPDEHKQAPDTIFKIEYEEKVSEIFKEEIDYASLIPKAADFTEALIEAEL